MVRANKQQKDSAVSGRLLAIDESLREIASLDELYNELITSDAGSKDRVIKKEEARFARDRLLKLSLHVKNIVGEISQR